MSTDDATDRVAALEQRLAELEARLGEADADGGDGTPATTRRQLLGSMAAGGVLGGLAGAGSAGAATSTVDGTPAALGTIASNVYRWADPGGLSGPYGSRNNVSSFDAGRIHIASDTGTWSYDTGSRWDTLPLAKNHIKFSNGRVYGGRFTGSNDAQVLIDAIADRPDGEGVVVQNPGFALDWEQQVDLPAAEPGFTLETLGVPRAEPTSGFTGDYAFYKPGSTASNDEKQGYEFGSFIIDDSANQVLTRGIEWRDTKEAIIRRSLMYDCPGVRLYCENDTLNQTKLEGPFVFGVRGPAAHLTGTDAGSSGGQLADQNWVYAPFFNETVAGEDADGDYSEVAFIDEGSSNNWIGARVELARVGFKARNARDYNFKSGQFDRPGAYEWSIKEEGDARGWIKDLFKANGVMESMRILAPTTKVEGRGDDAIRSSAKVGEPVDVFDMRKRLTGNMSLESMGFASSGTGSVDTSKVFEGSNLVELATGSTSGDTIELSTGDAFKSNSVPKAALSLRPIDAAATDNVVVRVGFINGDDSRAEFVFDPNDTLGGTANFGSAYGGDEWYFDVVTGGTVRTSTATGVAPDTFRAHADGCILSINCEDRGSYGRYWSGAVNHGDESADVDAATGWIGDVADGGQDLAQSAFRISVETRAAATKSWQWRSSDSMRCYRLT